MNKQLSGLLLAGVFIASVCLSGCVQQPSTTSGGGIIVIPSVRAASSENPKYAMAEYYNQQGLTINASGHQNYLPLALVDDVENWGTIKTYFSLSSDQKRVLRENGFVVIPYQDASGSPVNDTVQPYKDLKNDDMPIFITGDTLLHLYHIQFNEILKGVEEREFYNQILSVSNAMLKQAKNDYSSFTDPDLKEAARRNVAFFAVGLSLLEENPVEIPRYVENNVSSELAAIAAHEGFSKSAVFHIKEDYSQYVPRGHYTRSELLKRYFKAMMWYGRMAFLIRGSDIVSEYDAKIATLQASLIASELPNVQVSDGENAHDLWKQIYAVTSFFVGKADDLTPYEYVDCLGDVFGLQFNVTELTNETKLLDLQVALAKLRSPKIYGGTGDCAIDPPFTKEKLAECLNKTKGMRLMGQRYIPDSFIFQQLVAPATGSFLGSGTPFTMGAFGQRVFPRGLDVMAVLGSQRAWQILNETDDSNYESYDQQIRSLHINFSVFNTSEWHQNLYWSWLYTLKPLLQEFNKSYPAFMQTQAWQDKELQTTLASWAELRHDTILYAKQSYTPRLIAIPPQHETKGYVEPVPEFYVRLQTLTNMTYDGLESMNVLNQTEKTRLQNLETILNELITISKKELENTPLTEAEYSYIRNIGEHLEELVTGVDKRGQQTTIIADVHTDANSGQCLEEGVGYIDMLLAAYRLPDGTVHLGAGPVLSYYEFKQPMDDRLTDEKWVELLESGKAADYRPNWISSFT